MWARDKSIQPAGFSTPPPTWKSGPANPPPMVPMSERKRISPAARCDLFHVAHKVPAGDSPYVRAKQVQVRPFFVFAFSGHRLNCLVEIGFVWGILFPIEFCL